MKRDKFYRKGRCKHLSADDSDMDDYGNYICLLSGIGCIEEDNCEDYEEEE
jgi:hypothetical protein